MGKIILALLGVIASASVANAQSFPKPPDVPAYVPITPTYAAGVTLNVTATGTAPADAKELADIPTVSTTGWQTTGSFAGTSGYVVTVADSGTADEAKFRTFANATHVLKDDPIRNYGQSGQSHCHTFFGNGSTSAFSTYASMRNRGLQFSLAGGGPLNGTGYWYPCMIKANALGDGKDYVIRPNHIVIYYNEDPTIAKAGKLHKLVRGLRYVTGFNMDTGDEGQFLRDAITTANAQSGTSGRYATANGSGIKATKATYNCNGVETKWLKNADGSDPFGGVCTAGQDMWIQVVGANCWDGENLWAPSGYKNVIPAIYDNVAATFVCPNNWYRLPALTLQVHFSHHGFSDYGTWRLASDDMAATVTGRAIQNGESFHTDWMNGWDGATLSSWLCNGFAIGSGCTVPHEMGDGIISPTLQLIHGSAAPNGRNPQVQLANNYDDTVRSNMWRAPANPSGMVMVHTH